MYVAVILQLSLVPSPTPSISSLLSTVLSSDEKLGVGLGTRLTSTCPIRTSFEGLNPGVLQAAIPGQ